ncbi:MAG: hypothetical protein V1858_03595 [Candidatus Gottesmanbacteria bacterium]
MAGENELHSNQVEATVQKGESGKFFVERSINPGPQSVIVIQEEKASDMIQTPGRLTARDIGSVLMDILNEGKTIQAFQITLGVSGGTSGAVIVVNNK